MEGGLRHREKSWGDQRGGGEGRARAVLGPAFENEACPCHHEGGVNASIGF